MKVSNQIACAQKKGAPGTNPQLYNDFYEAEPFVQTRTDAPGVKDVVGTNYCHVFVAAVKGRIIGFSAIDNIVKGASGQAIQNMNVAFGLQETLGLI